MADAHGRLSVVETKKVNVCVVVDICVFITQPNGWRTDKNTDRSK